MALSAKLEKFKAYAEKLNLEVSVTSHDHGNYIVVKDRSYGGGYLQIIETYSHIGGRSSHGAYVTWISAGTPHKVTLRNCYGILQQFNR